MPFELHGRLTYRLYSFLLLLWASISVTVRRLLHGPRLSGWTWGFETTTAFLQLQEHVAFDLATIADQREFTDALVFRSPALAHVQIEGVEAGAGDQRTAHPKNSSSERLGEESTFRSSSTRLWRRRTMFDPGMVITSVQRNQYSPDWRIMRGKSHMGCAVVGAVLLLCFGGLVVFLGGAAFVGSLGSSNALLSLLIALGVLLLLGGLFIWGAIAILRSARKEGRSLLVLLPQGVVECYRGKADKITALRFDRIRRMDMNTQTVVSTDSEGNRHSSTNYWLNVYDTAGRYQKWGLRQTYGDPIVIGGNIIAAYEYYRHHPSQHP